MTHLPVGRGADWLKGEWLKADTQQEQQLYLSAQQRPVRWSAALLLLPILMLVGCGGQQATIPVAVSCVKEAPAVPKLTDEAAILAMDDFAATLTVWTERLLLRAYSAKSEAVIAACK